MGMANIHNPVIISENMLKKQEQSCFEHGEINGTNSWLPGSDLKFNVF